MLQFHLICIVCLSTANVPFALVISSTRDPSTSTVLKHFLRSCFARLPFWRKYFRQFATDKPYKSLESPDKSVESQDKPVETYHNHVMFNLTILLLHVRLPL